MPNGPGGTTVKEIDPSGVSNVRSTGVETQDIISCADELARDLMAIPEIAQTSGYRMALREVKNLADSRVDAEIISNDIRHQLIRQCSPHIRFVLRSRDGEFAEIPSDVLGERDLKNEGVVDQSQRRPLAGVDFFLSGELRSHTVVTERGRDEATFIWFFLYDADSAELVWEHAYGPIRKEALRGRAYR